MATTLLCPGSPRSGPQLRHEQRPGAPSGCAPALREWLDGVSDALCMLPPQLRDYRPFATTATRSRLHLPGTTGLRVRSPWPAADAENGLTDLFREELFGLYGELRHLDERIAHYDEKIEQIAQADERMQRLVTFTPSKTVGSWQPGWGWCQGSIPPAANQPCWGSTNGAMFTYAS